MSAVLVTASELARSLGVSPTAVAKARNSGRLTAIGDRFDLAVAQIQWEKNRRRQRAEPRPAAPVENAAQAAEAGTGGAYWDAKTRREAAEASIAELKEAELRGDLVRKVAVEREIASRLVALRESLEVLADRLAALVAAEPDAAVCRRLLRDEHRRALEAFAGSLEQAQAAQEAADGAPERDLVALLFRQYLQPRQALTVDQWADRYRVLAGETSAEPGQWRTERTPYLRQILQDLSDDSGFEEIVLQFGTQLGKSESGLNWLGYCVDHDPGPMMLILPTVDIAKRFSKQRLAPMIRETPSLRARIREARARDSGNTTLVKEFPGGLLVVTGANSAAGLASMPSRILYADEVDDYPDDVDGQGEPLGLATARQDTFARRKRLLSSSPKRPPGFSTIEAEYNAGTRFRYFVPCPHCGEHQVLEWGGKDVAHGLKWSGNDPSSAHYVCRHCGAVIEEHRKAAMLAGGRWIGEDPAAAVRSYHLSSLYSPLGWLSWSTIVGEFLEAARALEAGKTAPMKTWRNTRLALTWAEPGARLQVHALRERGKRAGAHRLRSMPESSLVLTAGVDVQDSRLEVSVYGWGPGEEAAVVDHQVLPGDPAQPELWGRLDAYLETRFAHPRGATLGIEAVAIDTGGHFTHTVYGYVRERSPGRRIEANGVVWVQRVYAIRGQDRPGLPVKGKSTSVDVNWRGKLIQRGVQLWMVGVNSAKDWWYARLRQERPGPGFVHIPADIGEEWCEQMTVESRVQARTARGVRMVWSCPTGKRNEAWDCAVYALFAAHAIGLERMTQPMWDRLADRIAPRQADLLAGGAAVPHETSPDDGQAVRPAIAEPGGARRLDPLAAARAMRRRRR